MRSQGGDNQPASKERPRLPNTAAWNRNCGRVYDCVFRLVHTVVLTHFSKIATKAGPCDSPDVKNLNGILPPNLNEKRARFTSKI